MAQALADAIGASKRQVQLWTDAAVIHCRPDTDRQGTGRRRLYDPEEIPIAAIVAAMARLKLPIGTLILGSIAIRNSLNVDFGEAQGKHPRDWFKAALRGEVDSYLMMRPDRLAAQIRETALKHSVSWNDKEALDAMLENSQSLVVINVRKAVSP